MALSVLARSGKPVISFVHTPIILPSSCICTSSALFAGGVLTTGSRLPHARQSPVPSRPASRGPGGPNPGSSGALLLGIMGYGEGRIVCLPPPCPLRQTAIFRNLPAFPHTLGVNLYCCCDRITTSFFVPRGGARLMKDL